MSGILFIIAYLLKQNYMSWGYIAPCIGFDFLNLLYVVIKVILWIRRRKAELDKEYTTDATPFTASIDGTEISKK